MTHSEIDNFIGVYDGFFSDKFCDDLVNHFEWCSRNNRTYGRPESENIKRDDSVGLNPMNAEELNFMHTNVTGLIGEFNDVFWNQCYAEYCKAFSVLGNYERHTIFTYKMQKTQPGGGYHVWHAEDGERVHCGRVGVYLLYLNDVEEGGETEFLYLSKRVKPKKGRLVIFPPNYPWAHRGNPPLSGTKYILTGWTEFN